MLKHSLIPRLSFPAQKPGNEASSNIDYIEHAGVDGGIIACRLCEVPAEFLGAMINCYNFVADLPE